MTFTLVHLYPEELGSSGDVGNVLTLAYRLRERGEDVAIVTHAPGNRMPTRVDAFLVGTGSWAAATSVLEDLRRNAHDILARIAEGALIVAVGTGAELLSQEIELPGGERIPGVGIFPFRARREAERIVGYVDVTGVLGHLVGFGDLSSVWERAERATPLGTGVIGPKRRAFTDGVVVNRGFATQIGGPVVALNPSLADWLIAQLARERGIEITLSPLETDHLAERARAVILDNFDQVFTTIALA